METQKIKEAAQLLAEKQAFAYKFDQTDIEGKNLKKLEWKYLNGMWRQLNLYIHLVQNV
jgi:hypothetical protein